MDEHARKVYERALRLLNQGQDQASIEQAEWLEEFKKEDHFQKLMERTAPRDIIFKQLDDAMEDLPELPDIFTQDQIEAVGQALAEIRRQMREEAQWKIDRIKREVGELRAELEVVRKSYAEWKKTHEQQ